MREISYARVMLNITHGGRITDTSIFGPGGRLRLTASAFNRLKLVCQ